MTANDRVESPDEIRNTNVAKWTSSRPSENMGVDQSVGFGAAVHLNSMIGPSLCNESPGVSQ